jgi:hypothetical protein
MKKSRFSLNQLGEDVISLVKGSEHRVAAVWAKACAERVLGYYEEAFLEDSRPRRALETLQAWIDTGDFKMRVIRVASLAAHAAAREVGADNPARSAARAAGQAVAAAHVKTHAIAAANYALQAIHRASDAQDADAAVASEMGWQVRYLRELIQQKL